MQRGIWLVWLQRRSSGVLRYRLKLRVDAISASFVIPDPNSKHPWAQCHLSTWSRILTETFLSRAIELYSVAPETNSWTAFTITSSSGHFANINIHKNYNICCLKVVTLSSSVVRTSTALVTSTFRLLRGNSELLTTLVNPVLTEVTEVNRITSTLANPLVRPATSLVTSPVTISTTLTQVETESYKVLFRARPITTTVINTRLVPTVLTTFATQTVTLPPPLLGWISPKNCASQDARGWVHL